MLRRFAPVVSSTFWLLVQSPLPSFYVFALARAFGFSLNDSFIALAPCGQTSLREDFYGAIDRNAHEPLFSIDPVVTFQDRLFRRSHRFQTLTGIHQKMGFRGWLRSIRKRARSDLVSHLDSVKVAKQGVGDQKNDNNRHGQCGTEDSDVLRIQVTQLVGRFDCLMRTARLSQCYAPFASSIMATNRGSRNGSKGRAFNCQRKAANQTPPTPIGAKRLVQ